MTIWVHLDHPCKEIDVWETEPRALMSPDDEKAVRGQGYVTLTELRQMRQGLIDLIETMDGLELTAAVPIDTRRLAYG